MKRLIVVVVLVLTLVYPSFAADKVGSIVGTYAVQGTNPDNTTYTLEVRIVEVVDKSAQLEYFIDGELGAIGIGIRTKDVLSVVFQTNGGAIGLASFKVEKNKLIGDWKLPGVHGFGTERFDRIPALTQEAPKQNPHTPPNPIPGTHKI